MKLLTALLILAQVISVTPASAKTVDPDFNYAFLKAGKLSLCPGVKLNVLAVQMVGATRSGGCCGTDEEWTIPPTYPFIGPIIPDFRTSIEGAIRGYNVSTLKVDKSFSKQLDVFVSLMEQIPMHNSEIRVCISKFNLVNLNQSHAAGTNITWDLGFKIFVQFDSADGHKSYLVQELAGRTQTNAPYYALYYDTTPRAQPLVTSAWPNIQGKFATFLAPVANGEAEKGLAAIKSELVDYIQ